jgi:arylsulfatase A-like enzyme
MATNEERLEVMPDKKPNILIIWGDDIGWFNVSAYNLGVMVLRNDCLRVRRVYC